MKRKTILIAAVFVLLAVVLSGCAGGIPTGTYKAYDGGKEVSGYSVTISFSLNGVNTLTVNSPAGSSVYILKSDNLLYRANNDGTETQVGSVSYNKKAKTLSVSGIGSTYSTYKKS